MQGWKRAAVSAVLAYALALQAVLFAVGGALHADPANLSQAVICVAEAASGQDHAPAKAHDALCCILNCHASGAAGSPLPVAALLDRPIPATVAAGLARHAPHLRLASSVLPVGSRAPPRLD
jgi:hypothetical protein